MEKFFPRKAVKAKLTEAKNMRDWLLLCLITHIIFFAVAIATIGFGYMLSQLLYIYVSWIAYMTLHRGIIIAYLILLVLNVGFGIFSMFDVETALGWVFYISFLVCYVIAVKIIGTKLIMWYKEEKKAKNKLLRGEDSSSEEEEESSNEEKPKPKAGEPVAPPAPQ